MRLASALLAALALACVAGGCRTADSLSLWADGSQSKRAIVEYVAAVTEEKSPDFIPPARRIAVFDFDGTLFCETDPTYFDWQMFEARVLDDPTCRASESQKAAARKARETGTFPPLGKDYARMLAEAYKDLSLDELDAVTRRFMEETEPGYAGMKRGEMFYLPMVQLVEYLVANGFTVYVVSGSDRFLVRALVCGRLPVQPWQVIGSDSGVVARGQKDRDALFYTYRKDDALVLDGSYIVKNLQMNKVTAIVRDIGVKPVLSFGNSHTDDSMANYVIGANEYKSLAFMLLCDDMKRENGNMKKADDMKRSCLENGWIPVSMRDDWNVIYEKTKGKQ